MTAHAADGVLRRLCDGATSGETIEVFVRSVTMCAASAGAGDDVEVRHSQHTAVHVRSFRAGVAGEAATETDVLDDDALCSALADARVVREAAPREAPPPLRNPSTSGFPRRAPASDCSTVERAARSAMTHSEVRVTVARTTREVVRTVSHALPARYASTEWQMHAVALQGVGAGAQEGAVHTSLEGLDAGAVLDRLQAARRRRSLPPRMWTQPAAVVLAPSATARLLSWVVPLLADLEMSLGRGAALAGNHLDIVDHQSGAYPNGHPFDDFGVPGRDVELVRGGRLMTGLRASPEPARSTSSAVRGRALETSVAHASLAPTCQQLDLPPGPVFMVDDLSVLHGPQAGGLEPALLTLRGALASPGETPGAARAAWTATVPDALRSIESVASNAITYRSRGLYGGASTMLRVLHGQLRGWSPNGV